VKNRKRSQKTFRADRVGSYFKAEWLPLALVTFTGLFYNIGLIATPWFEGRLAQCLADILGGSKTASAMVTLVIFYIAVTLAVQVARFIKRFYVRRFANNINRRMKGVLYANLVRESRASLEEQGAGELLTKAISDVDDCAEGMRKFTTELFDTGVALVGYAVMLFIYDWRLAILSLLFTPASYYCAARMKKTIRRAGSAYKKAAGSLSAATLDRARNSVTYRVYGCEKAREEVYENALENYEKTAVKNSVWQSALPPLYLAAAGAGVLFILWFGSKNVLGTGWRAWDIAAFTTFLSCFTKLTVKSSKVAKLFNSVQKAEVSWDRIKPLMKNPEPLEPLEILPPATVTLKDLSFAYADGKPIFSGLSLSAAPGEIIGVTGPVACGKSTFGRVFLCESPYSGSVRFGNRELSSLSAREIASAVGYLGHDAELFSDTIKNNVLCRDDSNDCSDHVDNNGKNDVRGSCADNTDHADNAVNSGNADVLRYLGQTALKTEALAMENGVETVIGTNGVRLSGGQAQRLALARTIAHPRPVMVLDDPFSALDRNTENVIFQNLRDYSRDKVIFLISHRLYHFPEMQKIIFIENGVATVGTHDELMQNVLAYKKLYESQTWARNEEE